MLYFTEKNTGKTYAIEPSWCMDTDITILNGICSFKLPKNIKPGVYTVQLKTKTSTDDELWIGTIPTNKDELQITVLDTQAFNLVDSIPTVGRALEQKEVEWTEIKTKEGVTDENV